MVTLLDAKIDKQDSFGHTTRMLNPQPQHSQNTMVRGSQQSNGTLVVAQQSLNGQFKGHSSNTRAARN